MKKYTYLYLLVLIFAASALQAQVMPDRHTTSPSDAWLSCTASMSPNPALGMTHWVKIDLASTEQLTDIQLWNYNMPGETSNGIATVEIHTTMDQVTWTSHGTHVLSQSDGSAFYQGEIIANLNGASARSVLLTAQDNYGGTCYGLSEVRFYRGMAVPVELASFDGQCDNKERVLEWTFADISDFGSVELQASLDGKDWSTIHSSFNPGVADPSNMYQTTFQDKRRLSVNKAFYRLKMIDTDGDFQYSNIVNVECEITADDLSVYPNPVRNILNINLDVLESMDVEYTIKDIIGKTILTGVVSAQSGANQFSVNVTTLVPGSYYISLDLGDNTIEKKILKVAP